MAKCPYASKETKTKTEKGIVRTVRCALVTKMTNVRTAIAAHQCDKCPRDAGHAVLIDYARRSLTLAISNLKTLDETRLGDFVQRLCEFASAEDAGDALVSATRGGLDVAIAERIARKHLPELVEKAPGPAQTRKEH